MDLSRRRFILIVDDNHDLTITLSLLLKSLDFDVDVVHNGHGALAVALTRRPDLVLLDLGLPGLDGFEVARRFRSDDRLKGVRIIAMTAYPRNTFPGRTDHEDFDHYLVKPVDLKALLTLISEAG
jgi:CheY-like chemotaxis protein